MVWMEPDLGWITISPFSTLQLAGPPPTLSQPDRSRPLKSEMASDGASPGLRPGATLGGTGDQNSVSSGLGKGVGCAATVAGISAKARIKVFFMPSAPRDNV